MNERIDGQIIGIIKLALQEDLFPDGDITSRFSVPDKASAKAEIIAKEEGILACSEIAQQILDLCAAELKKKGTKLEVKNEIKFLKKNGDKFKAGEKLAEISGAAPVLLAAERTLLNFLQRLSGVATYTSKLTELIKDYPTKLLDTRKTMPGFRLLEKEAVAQGGGSNHRVNLSDMILLKENHLIFNQKNGSKPDLKNFVEKTKDRLQKSELGKNKKIKIECEVENEDQLEGVVLGGADIVMLDNFDPSRVKKALATIDELKKKHQVTRDIKVEASGGITEETIVDYAKTGVDYISTGSITTKASNIDLSMLITSL